MIFLKLAMKSLRNRSLTTVLTVFSIALSVILLLSVERAKRAAEDGFTQTISKTDLIVGARTGPVQLILFTVFNVGAPTQNISYKTYQEVKNHPAIAWTIPYSLGDAHKGFRVVGTNEDFFKHYRFRGNQPVEFASGKKFDGIWDVVIGAEVARKLKYRLGDPIVVTHGVTKGEGVQHHDEKPFIISGILKPTGTPLDRAVYVSLEGMKALHTEEESHEEHLHEKHSYEEVHVDAITSFFVGARSRIETLKLQREINDFKGEPLLAIIPGATLSELWEGVSHIESVLRIISWMVVVVGFLAMLISLTTTLNERRREMSILRAIGATSTQIVGLLVFESALLSFLGVLLGTCFAIVLTMALQPWIEAQFGLYLSGAIFTMREGLYIFGAILGGTVIGLIPALKAQKNALKDGLSVRL